MDDQEQNKSTQEYVDQNNARVSRRDLCNLLLKKGFKKETTFVELEILLDYLLCTHGLMKENLDQKYLNEIVEGIRNFLSYLKKKLKAKKVSLERLLENEKGYFDSEFKIPPFIPNNGDYSVQAESEDRPKKTIGRPRLEFHSQQKRSQLYVASKIRQKYPPAAVKLAYEQNVRAEGHSIKGKKDLAFVIKKCDSSRGITVKKARDAISSETTSIVTKTPEQALFFLLSNSLTKDQYKKMKAACRESGADIWPNYDYVRDFKDNLRPDGIDLQRSDCILVPLQELLNHTIKRTLDNNFLFEKLVSLAQETGNFLEVTLVYKLGFDASGSHEIPQQPDAEGDIRTEKHLMGSQMVPLQIVSNIGGKRDVIYEYPNPNSPHSCRPIRLCFEKENQETIRAEYTRLQDEMKNLSIYEANQEPQICFSFEGLFTLIDGKVLSAITGISSLCCPQCGKGPKELRKRHGDFDTIPENLSFGISILHFGLRTAETLIKIGYKQTERVFTAREGNIEPNTFRQGIEKTQEQVQKRFKDELGLVVDKPRPGGLGSTNTGNVARKMFANPVVTASICGVSTVLVSNLSIIWRTLASGLPINSEEFEKFCNKTLDIYFDEELGAPWYPLPPTLHRVLVHGKELIENCSVPFGLISEECSEGNNKFLREYESHHTRKISNEAILTDLFHRLMDMSDPTFVSFMAKSKSHQPKTFPIDMKKLLIFPCELQDGESIFDNSFENDSDMENSDSSNDETFLA